MLGELQILSLLLIPLLGIFLSAFRFSASWILRICVGIAALEAATVIGLLIRVYRNGRIFAAWGHLFLDMLSVYHLCLVAVVFLPASIYALGYFDSGFHGGLPSPRKMRRYGMLWNGFLASLVLVFLADNLGVLWVALETTTLVSAFLIITERNRFSIEAMWKYLLICSVGIAFAFLGIVLLSAASRTIGGASGPVLSWCQLSAAAGQLEGKIMLAAFIFILVGFGTKAGLAPMHTWLPDAHSQAPTPVSAAFSGVMLNGAFYGILRFLPLTEKALGGDGQAHQLILIFGLISIIVAAAFMPAQVDIKRLLAYSTVEHMGIIAVGVGLGGAGTFAALYHALNHSLSKCLAFFSAGGMIKHYGSREIKEMRGALIASPLWGGGFLLSILILIGVAPFAIFMSELKILQAALDRSQVLVPVLFLAGCAVVFVSALNHAMKISMGAPPENLPKHKNRRTDVAAIFAAAFLLLVLGIWLPRSYQVVLEQASSIIEIIR